MSQSNVIALPPRGGVPAAFAGRNLPDMNAAAQAGIQASFAVIGFKGRNWRIKYRGEEVLLKDSRGVPLPTLDVVIVGVSSAIAKQFYAKKYSEGDDSAPDCFSVNGVHPDPASPNKQCDTCAVCPQNIWGSKVNENGKKVKACQDTRRLAVVPYGDFENKGYGGPMLLRLPPASLANFANYGRELSRFSAQPYMVRTTIGFDYDVAYPLITFTAAGWLTEEDAGPVADVLENPLVDRMLETEVVEATHDPAEPASTLAQGGPPKAFVAPQAPQIPQSAPPVPVQPPAAVVVPPAPQPAPAPAPVAPVTQAAPVVQAEDDEEAALAKQLAEARARKAAAKAKAEAEAQAQAAEAPAPAPAAPAAPVPLAAKPLPQVASADLDSLIGDLLAN